MKKLVCFMLLSLALVSCGKTDDETQTETQTQEYQDMQPLRSSESGGGGEGAIETGSRD